MIAKRLKKGDKIGIISPSSILKDEESINTLNESITKMNELGFEVVKGKYAFTDETGYGTTARHKADDINAMFSNNEIKAIFSTTGGENSISTFDYIDWNIIKNNPKIICGFSDTTSLLTSLLNEINEKTGLITFYGPSLKSISSGETDYRLKAVLDRFVNVKNNLFYEEDLKEVKIINKGKAKGKLVGGNLTLTTDLISGKYKINFENKILMIEDLAVEYLVNIK